MVTRTSGHVGTQTTGLTKACRSKRRQCQGDVVPDNLGNDCQVLRQTAQEVEGQGARLTNRSYDRQSSIKVV